MEFNIIKAVFVLYTIYIGFLGYLINNFEHKLPAIVSQFFRYGKFSYKGQPTIIAKIQVSKSIFKHFYIFGSVWSTTALLVATYIYFFNGENLLIFRVLLDMLVDHQKETSVSAVSAWLALALFTGQTYKRLYETMCVSVFSNTYMNFSYYIVGFTHYFACVCAIIAEAPGFAQTSFEHKTVFVLSDLKWTDIGGVFLFIWAARHQYNCAVILADLRKNKKGIVEHYKYMIPKGDLFEYLSSPHMFCEIMIYVSLAVILWGHTTWPYVFIWVLTNQVVTALFSHWWIITEFKDYPKNRYAVIPYIL